MKNPSSDAKWLNNHWKIFRDLLNRADFQEEIADIRRSRANDKYMPPMPFGEVYAELFTKHSIPISCMLALEYLIEHPEATDEQLRTRLSSPIRWISHQHGAAGPADDMAEEYQIRTHKGAQLRKDALVIEIMPYTKLSELKDFIDRHSDELNQVLQNPSVESDWLFPSRLSKRIDEPNKLHEDILALHRKGRNSSEIAKELGIDDTIDQSNIRKIISVAKKKRKGITG